MLDSLSDAAATYTELDVQVSLDPHDSDHVSFLDAGIPAVLTIEGTDDANPRIHTANDTLEHVSSTLALAILAMNVAFTAEALGRVEG